MWVCMCVCKCVRVWGCVRVCVCVWRRVYVCVCMYLCMYDIQWYLYGERRMVGGNGK
jgi:hypothetical protein